MTAPFRAFWVVGVTVVEKKRNPKRVKRMMPTVKPKITVARPYSRKPTFSKTPYESNAHKKMRKSSRTGTDNYFFF